VEITAIGYKALRLSTGSYNTAVGLEALTANTTGQINTAIGGKSCFTNATGSDNTAVGYGSPYYNSATPHHPTPP
jgi:trimeric autotransporter adhesin